MIIHVGDHETPVGDMNPGIRRTVQWLRDNGFKTCDSGDGKTHEHECDRPIAYVTIRVDPSQLSAECDRLLLLLKDHGVDLAAEYEKMGDAYQSGTLDLETQSFPTLQAQYGPVDGVATLDLACVDDALMWP